MILRGVAIEQQPVACSLYAVVLTMRQELQEAIQLLPDEDTAAYLEALSVAPNLVEKESNPEACLMSEDGKVDSAARRLTNYWKERKRIFKDRAFLPMDASGQGTLTAEDVEALNSGVFTVLPPNTAGHPVVFSDFDRSPFKKGRNESSRPRIRFYFFNRVSMEFLPNAQTKGIVLMRLMPLEAKFSNRVGGEMEHLLLRCIPFKMFALQVCCLSAAPASSVAVKTILPSVLQRLGKELATKAHVHVGKDPSDFLERLRLHGFEKDSLAESVGGTMSFEAQISWRKDRQLQGLKQNLSARLAAVSTEVREESCSALQSIPSLLQFVLGVLVMLEDRKKMKLAGLLRDPKTQSILKGLLKPLQMPGAGKQPDAVSAEQDTTADLARGKKRKLDVEEPSAKRVALLEKIRAAEEDNARLSANIKKRLMTTAVAPFSEGGDSPLSFMPDRVYMAFGVLTLLEQKKGCELRHLLTDSHVQMILRGLLGATAAAK